MNCMKKMAEAIALTTLCHEDSAADAAESAFDVLMESIPDLDLPERRCGYWGHKHGYQVAYTSGNFYRVRLHGRVICKNIKGIKRAFAYANNHHRNQIRSVWTEVKS
jgi:hypothetical protein